MDYRDVPKDVEENLEFRVVMLREARRNEAYQHTLFDICKDDILFWINAFCLAAGTLVVTDRGLVPIEDVTAADLVWDGEAWVSQGGPLCQGRKSVIFEYGIRLTPDHKVLTTHGWKNAEEGFDRAEVRLPDGYQVCRAVSEHDQIGVALSVRVREREHCGRQQSSRWSSESVLVVPERSLDARTLQVANLCDMVRHACAMQQSEEYSLSSLRGKRNSGLRAVEEVRELRRGHGYAAARQDGRENQQRRQLRAEQLSLGFSQGASQQHAKEHIHSDFAGQTISARNCEQSGNYLRSRAGAPSSGMGRGSTAREEEFAVVYDLVNCGPRRAFTVIDCNGEPLLVHNCYTFDPRLPEGLKTVPFCTYAFQDEAILEIKAAIENGQPLVIWKSRDMGASWMSLVVMLWFCIFRKQCQFMILSRVADMVDKKGDTGTIFWKVDFVIQNLPEWIIDIDEDLNQRILNREFLKTGGAMLGSSTTEAAGVGGRATAVFIDEFSRFNPSDAQQVRSGLADVSRCRIYNFTRNPHMGKAHPSYELVRQGQRGDIRLIRLHWTQHPEKSKGWYKVIDRQVEIMDKSYEFPPDYEFQLDGRFVDHSPWFDNERKERGNDNDLADMLEMDDEHSTHHTFDMQLIADYALTHVRPPLVEGEILCDPDGNKSTFAPGKGGSVKLWMRLDMNNDPPRSIYVGACDVSYGKGATNSVCSVARCDTGVKVIEFATPFLAPIDFALKVVAMFRWLSRSSVEPARLGWERQGPGDIFGDEVLRLGYMSVHWEQSKSPVNVVTRKVAGFNPQQKADWLARYQSGLSKKDFINHSREALEETKFWVNTATGPEHLANQSRRIDPSGARANHGDRVIADCLCYLMMLLKGGGRLEEEKKVKPGTFEELLLRDERSRTLLQDGSLYGNWAEGKKALYKVQS